MTAYITAYCLMENSAVIKWVTADDAFPPLCNCLLQVFCPFSLNYIIPITIQDRILAYIGSGLSSCEWQKMSFKKKKRLNLQWVAQLSFIYLFIIFTSLSYSLMAGEVSHMMYDYLCALPWILAWNIFRFLTLPLRLCLARSRWA